MINPLVSSFSSFTVLHPSVSPNTFFRSWFNSFRLWVSFYVQLFSVPKFTALVYIFKTILSFLCWLIRQRFSVPDVYIWMKNWPIEKHFFTSVSLYAYFTTSISSVFFLCCLFPFSPHLSVLSSTLLGPSICVSLLSSGLSTPHLPSFLSSCTIIQGGSRT